LSHAGEGPGWVYQHQISAIEVNNSAKVTLASFNKTALFLCDEWCWKMLFLKRDGAVAVFAWVTYSSDCRFELQVE